MYITQFSEINCEWCFLVDTPNIYARQSHLYAATLSIHRVVLPPPPLTVFVVFFRVALSDTYLYNLVGPIVIWTDKKIWLCTQVIPHFFLFNLRISTNHFPIQSCIPGHQSPPANINNHQKQSSHYEVAPSDQWCHRKALHASPTSCGHQEYPLLHIYAKNAQPRTVRWQLLFSCI